MAESATGMKLRGRHSNNSNSTASSTAAIGAAKMADIPPAAPATRRIFRSAGDRSELCEERAEGPTRHNDRTLRAKRAAGSNGKCGRKRFEHSHFRRHPAATEENRLQRFRNAVPAIFSEP